MVFRSFEGSSALPRGADQPGQAGKLFDESNTWLRVPDKLVFVHVENPYEVDAAESLALERATEESPSVRERPTADYAQLEDNMPPSCSTNDNDTAAAALPTPQVPDDVRAFELQLMRHFKQVPSQWLDTFDTNAFFSCRILSMATSNSLLKSAVCALAAKHLSRIEHSPSANPSLVSLSKSLARVAQTSVQASWPYQAARYYDRATSLLKEMVGLYHSNNDAVDSAGLTAVLAAAAILGMFELMDGPGDGSRAHIGALRQLNPPCTASGIPNPPVTFPPAIVRCAVFWNLVRQDFLCAFISERQTHLNLDSILFGQGAGLATDGNAETLAFSPFSTADYHTSVGIPEDARSNELFWILSRVVNFLTAGDAVDPEDFALPVNQRLPLGVTQDHLLERWSLLDMDLRKWLDSLPPTFEIKARTSISRDCLPDDQSKPPALQQVWYELPTCAATMQAYHMACVLLLINKPQESTAIRSTLAARFRYYRKVQVRVLWHAREICGISLADPPDPVRIYSVLPLFVAGHVFHTPQEQKIVIDLLSSIQDDLGLATSYHRDKLYVEWAREHDE